MTPDTMVTLHFEWRNYFNIDHATVLYKLDRFTNVDTVHLANMVDDGCLPPGEMVEVNTLEIIAGSKGNVCVMFRMFKPKHVVFKVCMPSSNIFDILNLVIDPIGSGLPHNKEALLAIESLHFEGCNDDLSDMESTGLKHNIRMSHLHHVRIGYLLFMNSGEVLR